MMTRIKVIPSVRGTNRKWYIAVAANCSRERSTSASVAIRLSCCRKPQRRRDCVAGHGAGVNGHLRAVYEREPQDRENAELEDNDSDDFGTQRGVTQSHARDFRVCWRVPAAAPAGHLEGMSKCSQSPIRIIRASLRSPEFRRFWPLEHHAALRCHCHVPISAYRVPNLAVECFNVPQLVV